LLNYFFFLTLILGLLFCSIKSEQPFLLKLSLVCASDAQQKTLLIMLNLILFGPPGAGKGTQSAQLIEKYGLVHLSTGDIFRAEIANQTPMGMKAKSFMDKGELVPDQVVIGMIENHLRSFPDAKGFIFDGFPRTVPQAEALDELLNGLNAPIKVVVGLEVEIEELLKRLLERGKTSGRSDDQDEELIRNRFNEYEQKTRPVALHYQGKGVYAGVQGIGEIDQIFDAICQQIDLKK